MQAAQIALEKDRSTSRDALSLRRGVLESVPSIPPRGEKNLDPCINIAVIQIKHKPESVHLYVSRAVCLVSLWCNLYPMILDACQQIF